MRGSLKSRRRRGRRWRLPAILAVAVIGIAVAALWSLRHRDPLTSLPAPPHDLRSDRDSATLTTGRLIQHFVLRAADAKDSGIGEIGIAVSLPEPLPRHRLPVLILLGGLATGAANLRYLPDAGDNAVIAYDWPVPVQIDNGIGILAQIPDIYRRAMMIPAQIASAIGWTIAQPWADGQSVSVLGLSLGALAAPAAEAVAERDGQAIGWTVLAYGGDPVGALLAHNPNVTPGILRPILAPLADVLLGPLEPSRNLPHLTGAFLVIEGRDDALVPANARARFRDAVPEPKTIRVLDGGHVGVAADQLPLLQEVIGTAKLWLIDQGAIQPF